MPNWCEVTITLRGSEAALRDCLDTIAPEQPNRLRRLSFQNIVPMSADLDIEIDRDIGEAALFLDASPLYNEQKRQGLSQRKLSTILFQALNMVNGDLQQLEVARYAMSNYRKHGYLHWYPWRMDHWGCKWDCGNENETTIEREPGAVTLYLDTPDQPPTGIFRALSAQFPDLDVSATFEEEGNGLYGSYENGVLTYDEPPDEEEEEDIDDLPSPSP